MRKQKIYLIAFLLLIGIALFLYLKDKGQSNNLTHKFSISDTSSISKIVFSYQDHFIELEKNENNWMLNKNYVARKRAVQTLLGGLVRLRVTSFVSDSQFPEVKQNLTQNPLKVWVYQNNKIKSNFLVYENIEKNSGTFMMMADENAAYKVSIPAYTGNIISLFRTDLSFWRNNILYASSPNKISAIKVNYTEKPEKSYALVLDENNNFIIYNNNEELPTDKTNTEKIQQYLGYFYQIQSEEFLVPENIQPGDTANLVASLVITDIYGNDKSFKFFLKPKYSENGVAIKNSFDLNRAYLKDMNTGELAIVNYVELDLIFKEGGYFLK